jgi:ectoine hydroxylase-related dioxygenase (phytanoyl-CoA dioxygenase family)
MTDIHANPTPLRPRGKVTEADIADFRRDGVVCIRGMFSPEEVETGRRGIDANIAAPSPRSKVASAPGDPGFFLEDFCNWQENAAYRELIFTSSMGEVAGRLMGSDTVRLYHDHLLVKEPNTRARTPWHQDQPYYNIDGVQNVSMWAPMDPVTRDATLEFVAGTHRGPWLMPRSFMTNEAKWFPEGTLEPLPDIEADREAYDIKGWALEPGDAVFFHMLTLHASAGVGNARRRVLSVRFLGDDIVHAPREWTTSPAFPGLTLPKGAPMHDPLFPVLWERAP